MRGSIQRFANDGQHRDAQPLRLAGRRGGRGLHAVVERRQRGLHAAQQRLARGIEHDAPPAPLEEREAELVLEAADLLAHRAVREVQLSAAARRFSSSATARNAVSVLSGRRELGIGTG